MKKTMAFILILLGVFFYFATQDMAPESRDAFTEIE